MEIFAHRGASGNAPENTMAAMKMAIKEKCDGIELDAQLTKDGEVVVFHDWLSDNNSNGSGKVSEYTLEEIKKLDFGKHFSEKFTGEKIVTLDEVLKFLPKEIILNIEIKMRSNDNRNIADKVADLLIKNNRIENTIISAFHHPWVDKIAEIIPELKLAVLYKGFLSKPIEYMENLEHDIYSVHICEEYVNKELIENIHEAGKKVYIWTVNNKELAKEMKEMGVDGIMSNYPWEMREFK